jgi:hypothetical protein
MEWLHERLGSTGVIPKIIGIDALADVDALTDIDALTSVTPAPCMHARYSAA